MLKQLIARSRARRSDARPFERNMDDEMRFHLETAGRRT